MPTNLFSGVGTWNAAVIVVRRTIIPPLQGERAGVRAEVPLPTGTDLFGSLAAM